MRRRGVRGGIGVRIGDRPAGAGAIGIAGITAGDKRFGSSERDSKAAHVRDLAGERWPEVSDEAPTLYAVWGGDATRNRPCT